MKLEVVTPLGSVVSDDADEVTLSGALGEMGILPGHLPLITPLKPGVLSYKKAGVQHDLAVSAGYVEVLDDAITVCAETAEPSGKIDAERARRARERAEKALAALTVAHGHDWEQAEAALHRSLARLQASSRGGQGLSGGLAGAGGNEPSSLHE